MNRPRTLPSRDEMTAAYQRSDPEYDGIFFTAVRTTGIFCAPSCGARKPRRENVDFYATAGEALVAGYRPCKRCRPLEPPGRAPDWLAELIAAVEADPTRRWRDRDLRSAGLSPERVRRWFRRNHGMTFHAYVRARRLGAALGEMRAGVGVSRSAFSVGYDSLSGFGEAFRRYFGSAPSHGEGRRLARVSRIVTPLGPMLAAATDEGLCLLEFADRRAIERQVAGVRRRLGLDFVPGSHPMIEHLQRELSAYFAGCLRRFTVPLAADGTAFQERVWTHLRGVAYGSTVTYAAVARALGAPKAVRAVARANGDNRLAILIPCHRVVGSDGKLRGYGGGLWRKRWLLELERAAADAGESPPSGAPPSLS